jgi:hypothetical protein
MQQGRGGRKYVSALVRECGRGFLRRASEERLRDALHGRLKSRQQRHEVRLRGLGGRAVSSAFVTSPARGHRPAAAIDADCDSNRVTRRPPARANKCAATTAQSPLRGLGGPGVCGAPRTRVSATGRRRPFAASQSEPVIPKERRALPSNFARTSATEESTVGILVIRRAPRACGYNVRLRGPFVPHAGSVHSGRARAHEAPRSLWGFLPFLRRGGGFTRSRRRGLRDRAKPPLPLRTFVLFVPPYSRTNSVTSRISTGPTLAARTACSTTCRSPTTTTTARSGRTYVLATRLRSSAVTAITRCT